MDLLGGGANSDYGDVVSAPSIYRPIDARGTTPNTNLTTNRVPVQLNSMGISGGIDQLDSQKTVFFKFTKKQQTRMYDELYKNPFDPTYNSKTTADKSSALGVPGYAS